MAVKCILTGQEKVNLSGDTMTGDLKVGSSSIGTNGYIEGTWLKTTKATESAGDFATISGDGWIYKRKPTDVLGDIGGQAKITASGLLKGNGNGGVTAAVAGKDYDTEIVYVNYTGDTPTKDNITNMTEVVAAYNAGKVIAIMAVANYDTSTSSKVPFFLTQAINNNGAIYVFYFIADYVSGTGDNTAISCPCCIQIQCSQTQTSSGYIYSVSSVTDYGLTKAFPAAHADTHKTGGDDAIAPSDIGAQPKITANGILKGDGTGNITAADETEVELVDITPELIGAQKKITVSGFLRGVGEGNVVADRPYFPIIVTETRTPDDATHTYIYTYSADKTYQEIRTAITQGYIPVAFLGGLWFYLSLEGSLSNYCFFAHRQSGNYISDKLECSNDNTWTRESRTCISREGPFREVPSLTLPEVIQNLENETESIKEKTKSISLPTASWTGSDPYTQTITISGSTANTKVDIQPSEELYDQLVADNVGYLAIKNVDGTLTAVAKGGKPSINLTVQVTYNNVY